MDVADDEMAVRQRIFNSTAPFSGSPRAELKVGYVGCSVPDQGAQEEERKEGKEDYMAIHPYLRQVLTQGTAEQVGEGPLKNSTFVAQAECESPGSQQFISSCSDRCFVATPNCFTSNVSTEQNHVACPTTASVQEHTVSLLLPPSRKKTRKRQKRKERKKEGKKKERHRQRIPSGVPEQESGTSPVQFPAEPFGIQSLIGLSIHNRSSSSSRSSCTASDRTEVQDTQGPPVYSHPQIYRRASLEWSSQACDPLSNLPSYGQESDSDSSLSSAWDCPLAMAGLRGSVSQGDPCFAGPFFKDVEKEVRVEEDEAEEEWSSLPASPVVNEGIVFYNENIKPVDSEYREGQEYRLTRFIKEGSYGEVFKAQDINTGYRFAAKKIPLRSFSSEEVGTWSALTSPRVVELFGVVREGSYVILLMEQKCGSLGQLIAERGRLPQDLGLHYHWQVLGALEYLLKKRVAHLDIKADNVLLSEDGKDTFLCDFGHAERLDSQGFSLSGFKDNMKGTETHMAPEIVKVEPRGAKADVWSSACMLLHMLNGCQPWTRYYNCRLYLKIANEPPPIREIPPDCSDLTAEVVKAGLQKDPVKRASAGALKERTSKALKELGGLRSSIRGPYTEPLQITPRPVSCSSLDPFPSSDDPKEGGEEEEEGGEVEECTGDVISPGSKKKLDNVGDSDDDNPDGEARTVAGRASQQRLLLSGLQCHLRDSPNHKTASHVMPTPIPDHELHKLERDFYLSSLSQLHPAEMQEQLLSCLSSDCHSNWESWDKRDSGRWSITPGDELSSGVFSYNSQADGQVFSMDWLGNIQIPPPFCFEGVDVSIQDFNRRSIRIRETRRVKVGHIATGISDQISERVYTLETEDAGPVGHDDEVLQCGLHLRCVSAPDFSPAWKWRIRDGLLETR
ncbi:mitogen-activated protein kinase kinase kinase 14 isoform X1 [Gadus chalcogrammus]|uniref:mitogen-activated protein kinase kinase kinase 14 isoform X1 n=2 Tax=Gadus chalcogrammus TaxID=1042646 RepID=UPI0024C3F7E9|nr:mitogen-activated protein kinase kinase kinase 14 isoform X1 [Gadus chalcogrammus]